MSSFVIFAWRARLYGEGERVDHLARVLRRRLHRRHPRRVLGRVRLEEDAEELELDVPREEPPEDDVRRRLVEVVGPAAARLELAELDREEALHADDLRDDAPELVEDDVDRVDLAFR